MSWRDDSQIKLIKNIDLPHSDKVVSIAKNWIETSALLVALAAAAFGAAMLHLFTGAVDGRLIVLAAVLFILCYCMVRYYGQLTSLYYRRKSYVKNLLASICGVAGFLVCLYFIYPDTLQADRTSSVLGLIGITLASAIAGALVPTLIAVAFWLFGLLVIPSFVIAWPLLYIMKCGLQYRLNKYSDWKNDNNIPIIKLNTGGGMSIHTGNRPVYVVSPELRRNGSEKESNIPRFRYQDFYRNRSACEALTNQALAGAVLSTQLTDFLDGSGGFDTMTTISDHTEPTVINPSTGLPMLDNTHSGIDIGGNVYGQTDTFGGSMSHDTSHF